MTIMAAAMETNGSLMNGTGTDGEGEAMDTTNTTNGSTSAGSSQEQQSASNLTENGTTALSNSNELNNASHSQLMNGNGSAAVESTDNNNVSMTDETDRVKEEPAQQTPPAAAELDNVPWAQRLRIGSTSSSTKKAEKAKGEGTPAEKNREKHSSSSSKVVAKEKKKESISSEVKDKKSKKSSAPTPTSSREQKGKKRKEEHSEDEYKAEEEEERKGDEEEDYDAEEEEEEYKPEKKKSKKSSTSIATPPTKAKSKLSSSSVSVMTTTKSSKSGSSKTVVVKKEEEEEDSGEVVHKKKKKSKVEVKEEPSSSQGSTTKVKKIKKEVEEEEVWRWWEEQEDPEVSQDGTVKWRTLEHKGPVFAPEYIPLPKSVKFKYDGKEMELSKPAEEVASFYAKMLDHDYTSKPIFNQNFFKDWRRVMTSAERNEIKTLDKCDFTQMHAYFLAESAKRKERSKEEKKAEKDAKDAEAKVYGFAMLDGYKQKIGNFRIEPPGLFRGRGDHPKMGSLKKRVQPEDVVINCSKGVKIFPPEGHKWREIRHDNTVTWLCSWTENVLGSNKYIMLNPSSKLKGQKDWEKFEKARKLKSYVGQIREQYLADFKSKEMRIRQRAVALYFIDKLALRAGNEKDTDEAADTVGCCSLRCEHIKLYDEMDGDKYVVEFDFLGKDSIRYYNRVPVEKQVFKNLKIFMEAKEPGDDLFDRLDTSSLNQYLKELMDGLTAKVFRTYNASITLQEQLDKLTNPSDSVHEKLLSYNRANRQVAILCNHQRAVPKTHEKTMENLENKIKEKKKEYKELKAELKKTKNVDEKQKKKYERLKEQLSKLETQRTDRDENKQIALGTSKLNYLDPRISVAWCKKYDVPIEKIFSKTQRDKFRWAIDMAKEDYIF